MQTQMTIIKSNLIESALIKFKIYLIFISFITSYGYETLLFISVRLKFS